MATDWYYTSNGERHGPVSSHKLKELADLGYLGPKDHVWKDGMADWVPATKVKGLFPNPPPPEPPPPPPPPGPPRREIPITVKGEVPVKVVAPREGVSQKIAKWVTIGWSLLCLLGVGYGILNIAANSEPTYGEFEEAGQFLGIGCGLAIWFIIWSVIAVPALVVWLLTRKT